MQQETVTPGGGIALGYPTTFDHLHVPLDAAPILAVTTFESDMLPLDWDVILNECAGISTPSVFSKDVFESAGIVVPIVVNPEGLNGGYVYKARTGEKPFTFLAIADRGVRKNWVGIAQAFVRAFGDNPDYHLILKMRRQDEGLTATNPNITFICDDYSEAEMVGLYQRCDCMVFATRGEGFGRPPREFARTGGLVLATNWSGLRDDIEKWGDPIDEYQLMPAWNKHPYFEGVGQWADVNLDALAVHMRRVAAMPIEERNALGERRAVAAKRLYTWDAWVNRIVDLWKRVNDAGHQRMVGHEQAALDVA
jgi:glycosyltransferase involved in cell wall biosynthesis